MESQTIQIGQIYRIKADESNDECGQASKDESSWDVCASENLRIDMTDKIMLTFLMNLQLFIEMFLLKMI